MCSAVNKGVCISIRNLYPESKETKAVMLEWKIKFETSLNVASSHRYKIVIVLLLR